MKFIKEIKLSKKGDLEMDELGKLLIALALLIVLIVIVTIYIGGEFSNQEDKVKGVFSILG